MSKARTFLGRAALAAAVALVLQPVRALAQEATNTPAGTQPSVGSFYFREKLQYVRLDDDPSPADREIDKLVATSYLAYGVTRTLSISAEVPVVYEQNNPDSGPTNVDAGLNDITLVAKWRPLQLDLGPVDSVRFAVFGGAEVPSGDGDLSSHSVDPIVGGVVTAILGRHGINQALTYKWNTSDDRFTVRPGDGRDDAVRFDTAYLYRLAPAAYTATTTAATYLTFEANGLYETGGDWEVVAGPGILYEARTFALEATLGLPVLQEVEDRPETRVVLTVGLRILF